jgi:UTP:GlnB (protein PII) uridylyltransferase
VLRWPSAEVVIQTTNEWAQHQAKAHADLLAIGLFGSYGRGDAGVGSDLDLLILLEHCEKPIWERLQRWDTGSLLLSCDLLVWSRSEWETLPQWNPRMATTLQKDLRWLVGPRDSHQQVAEAENQA